MCLKPPDPGPRDLLSHTRPDPCHGPGWGGGGGVEVPATGPCLGGMVLLLVGHCFQFCHCHHCPRQSCEARPPQPTSAVRCMMPSTSWFTIAPALPMWHTGVLPRAKNAARCRSVTIIGVWDCGSEGALLQDLVVIGAEILHKWASIVENLASIVVDLAFQEGACKRLVRGV